MLNKALKGRFGWLFIAVETRISAHFIQFSEAVTTMLILRGAPALSAFRHEKLFEQLRQKVPSVSGLYAEFAHFVEVSAALRSLAVCSSMARVCLAKSQADASF